MYRLRTTSQHDVFTDQRQSQGDSTLSGAYITVSPQIHCNLCSYPRRLYNCDPLKIFGAPIISI